MRVRVKSVGIKLLAKDATESVIESVIWTYRLPHGEGVATRAAVLWRKPRAALSDL